MDDSTALPLIFSRRRLPLPTVRWWCWSQVAKLLEDPRSFDVIWQELCRRIVESELESEVVELMTPISLTKFAFGDQLSTLRALVKSPSILSDYICSTGSAGKVVVPSWLSQHSGEVPAGFEISAEERKNWGRRVQGAIRPLLERIEKRVKFPLVKQFEFEMFMLGARTEQRSGYLEYFASEYRENSVHGGTDTTQDHLWRSAYLRMLSFCVASYQMPIDLAQAMAMDVSPLSPLVGAMSPPGIRPAWIPYVEWNESGAEVQISDFLSCICDCASRHIDDTATLGVFDGRLVSTSKTIVELLAVTVNSPSNEAPRIDEVLKQARLQKISAEASSSEELILEIAEPHEVHCLFAPLSLGVRGYLQNEILARPPWCPTIPKSKEPIRCRFSSDSGLTFFHATKIVARTSYWNVEWEPAHHALVGPSASTVTLLTTDGLHLLDTSTQQKPEILWRAMILKRNSDYGAFTETTLTGRLLHPTLRSR